jgi:uncharacterized protein (DUF2062 family)
LGFIAVLPIDPVISYASTWISNPLTVLPFTFAEIEIGSMISTGRWQRVSISEMGSIQRAVHLGLRIGLGALLFASVSAIIAFALSYALAKRLASKTSG